MRPEAMIESEDAFSAVVFTTRLRRMDVERFRFTRANRRGLTPPYQPLRMPPPQFTIT
jgi:hypothetical protein